MRRGASVIEAIDWRVVLLYVLLVLIGWVNIYSAVYNPQNADLFDLSQRYGKQFVFIIAAVVIATMILIVDGAFFTSFSLLIYGFVILLLVGVLIFGVEIKGARSWFQIGSFSLQPAEFAKFATALGLAKYLSMRNVKFSYLKTKAVVSGIIFLPALLILLQNDTGSTLVYAAFVFVLYREGLSPWFLIVGFTVAVLFVVSVVFRNWEVSFGGEQLVLWGIPMTMDYVLLVLLTLVFGLLIYLLRKKIGYVLGLIGFWFSTVVFVLSVNYIVEKVLSPHQSNRIKVLLGIIEDPQGLGYNVNQSLIAIGSGGFFGKGFLQGTQTKFNFVPEQSTDFIFCTIGEEWGFLGTSLVVGLFLALLLLLINMAERQRSTFSRIYGYSVAAIFFFHFLVNIGMAIGLAPVIGIPLPFISYGGSSLWAYTILLFIFVKLDAESHLILR